MSSTNKKKQDEEHLKILREMVALAHNKHCFDCNQRGPTYLNMTIGSFVCTSCSGLLRGLNPPHRVKSISMASFTPEEMEFIKSRGNAFCQRTWLGLCDSRSLPAVDARDEVKMREAMTQRYEKKRWYVQPTDAMYEDARRQNTPVATATSKVSRPGLTVTAAPSFAASTVATAVDNQKQEVPAASQWVGPAPFGTAVQMQSVPTTNLMSTSAAPSINTTSVPANSMNKFDLLDALGSDPFASQTSASAGDGFANFAAFSGQPGPAGGASFGQSKQLFAQPAASQPPSFTAVTASGPPPVSADKYFALAELESVLNAPAVTASVDWDGSSSTRSSWSSGHGLSGPVFGGAAGGGGGSMFGSSSTAAGSSSGFMFGVPASSAPGHFPTGMQPGFAVPAAHVANPFGQATVGTAQPATVNPFMSVSGFAPQQVPAGYPTQPVHSAPGYGHFSAMPPATGGAVFGAPNGAAMWGVPQPMGQPVGQVPQQFAASWGQAAPSAANPFMGNVPARSTNVTNPFL